MGYFSVTPQIGELSGTSITATTAGTATAVVTLNRHRRIVIVANTCNQDIMLTYDGADFLALPAGVGTVIDLGPGEFQIDNAKVIGAYNRGAAPTAGRLSITLI